MLLTLRNILVCESLLFLDEKARNQLTLARTGGVQPPPPPEVFSRIAKKRRRVAPPGFGLHYGANLAPFLQKNLTESGQVTEL